MKNRYVLAWQNWMTVAFANDDSTVVITMSKHEWVTIGSPEYVELGVGA